MKFKIRDTDLLIDGKKYKEGDEIELTEEQAKKLERCLEPIRVKEPKKKGGRK